MSYEFYTAAGSLITAVAALALTIWSGLETRRYYRLSVLPRVQMYTRTAWEEDRVGIFIKNDGTGPAIVRDFQVYLDDKLMITLPPNPHQVSNFLQELGRDFSNLVLWGVIVDEGLLSPGQEVLVVAVNSKTFPVSQRQGFLNSLTRIGIVVSYESIYQEKYKADWRKGPVKASNH